MSKKGQQNERIRKEVMALEAMRSHAIKQTEVIGAMIEQAEVAMAKAGAAPNFGPGSVLKMIIPVMEERIKFFNHELSMWNVIIEIVQEELLELTGQYDDSAEEELEHGSSDGGGPEEELPEDGGDAAEADGSGDANTESYGGTEDEE